MKFCRVIFGWKCGIICPIFIKTVRKPLSTTLLRVCCLFLSVWLFFLRPSLALWVSLGIPTSILGGFWFFIPFDLTINVITMFAFIVTLGIVVDDAIVVGENISSWQDRGKPAIEAAVCGIREVAIPVVFSVLTNMLTFLPILFVPGMMGKIWAGLPLIVIAVFSCSLLESLFVLPAHLSHQKKVLVEENAVYSWWKEPIKFICQKQDIFNKAFLYFVEYRYGAFINYVIKNRYVTVAIGIALLFAASAMLFPDGWALTSCRGRNRITLLRKRLCRQALRSMK